jgi:ABC-type phosphate transport system substrate-binding protein
MKKFILTSLFFSAFFVFVSAQNNNTGTIYIKSSRFVSPLIEKWINEYSKVNSRIHLKIADNQVKSENIDLELVVSDNESINLSADENILLFGRYAILPVAGKENPLSEQLKKKRLNAERLKDLFFEKDIFDEENTSSGSKYNAIVYSGNGTTSVTSTFASHFGYDPSRLKGKRISGDDSFLINAILKDQSGITFNALGNIFDLNNRKLKTGISILPLDIKKEFREYFTESSDIDKILTLLETESVDIIPTENIGFRYNPQKKEVNNFLTWILKEGKSYNHTYGILNPDEKTLTAQSGKINGNLDSSVKSE